MPFSTNSTTTTSATTQKSKNTAQNDKQFVKYLMIILVKRKPVDLIAHSAYTIKSTNNNNNKWEYKIIIAMFLRHVRNFSYDKSKQFTRHNTWRQNA